jgi:amicyanin
MRFASTRRGRFLVAFGIAAALAIGTSFPAPEARAGTTHAVDIVGFAFAPATLTVAVGDTVTWTNRDPDIHTATSTTETFDSGNLEQDESFSFTFTAAGTYDYLCTPHPFMTGRIVVEAAAPPPAATAGPTATPPPAAAPLPNVAMPPPRSPSIAILGAAFVVAGVVAAALRLRRR